MFAQLILLPLTYVNRQERLIAFLDWQRLLHQNGVQLRGVQDILCQNGTNNIEMIVQVLNKPDRIGGQLVHGGILWNIALAHNIGARFALDYVQEMLQCLGTGVLQLF